MADVTTPFVLGSFAVDYRLAAAEYGELFTAAAGEGHQTWRAH
jgi:hypothetical protein